MPSGRTRGVRHAVWVWTMLTVAAGAVLASILLPPGEDSPPAMDDTTATPSAGAGAGDETRLEPSPTLPAPTRSTATRPTPTPPTPTPPTPTRPSAPPARWVGARVTGDDLEVVLHDGAEPVTLARHPRTDPELAGTIDATDVVLADELGVVFVALCCEPTSGAVLTVSLEDPTAALEPATIQGFRLEVGDAGTLLARTDTFGILGIGEVGGESRVLEGGAAAADVAVEPGPRPRVAVLVDPALASMPGASSGPRGVRVLAPGDGTLLGAPLVALEAPVCRLAFLAGDRLALLRGDSATRPVFACGGAVIDLLDVTTGTIERDVVTLDVPAVDLATDASGHFLLATGADGTVRWLTLDGEDGEDTPDGEATVLATGGYVAADW